LPTLESDRLAFLISKGDRRIHTVADRVGTLSTGNRGRRVVVAKALIDQPAAPSGDCENLPDRGTSKESLPGVLA
jgi:hypothetical protein